MKHLLIYFTEHLHLNNYFLDFVKRNYENKGILIDSIIYANSDESKLSLLLELNAKRFDAISIIADEKNFSATNKILATLKNSELELIDDEFILKDRQNYCKNSVLLSYENISLNILKAKEFELANILLDEQKIIEFLLFDMDLESAKILLETSSKTYGISTEVFSVLENLIFVRCNCLEFADTHGFLSCVKSLFDKKFIDEKNIFKATLKALQNNTFTTAESCTAGKIAAKFSECEGASNNLQAALVTYSPKSKITWLNVEEKIANSSLIYSQNCAVEMAFGALKITKSSYAIAITGVLGIGEHLGTKSGTVYLCVANKNGKILCEQLQLKGDRILMQELCAQAAALLLYKLIIL